MVKWSLFALMANDSALLWTLLLLNTVETNKQSLMGEWLFSIESQQNASRPAIELLRNKLRDYLQQIQHESLTGLLLIGIDNFNSINYAYGRDVGDQLLRDIAQRLAAFADPEALLLWKGGDEFVLAVNHVKSEHVIRQLAKRLLKLFEQPFVSDQYQSIYLTISIGCSVFPHDGTDPERLLSAADIALHAIKERGKNYFQFFTEAMGRKEQMLQKIKQGLSKSIREKDFFLCYQPQIKPGSNEIVGVEALLRWKHPQLGVLGPDEFISTLENTDHIIEIGSWVLETACKQLKQWQRDHGPLRVALNVAKRQLNATKRPGEQYFNLIKNVLKTFDLKPGDLELEITERILMSDDTNILMAIKKLKEIGVRIACDDFGAGYSSLSRLRDLPLDTLKLDKTLIDDLVRNSKMRTIVEGMIHMAQQLQVTVIAEGIENEEQYALLTDMDCDLIQGYFCSKPQTSEKISDLLSKFNAHHSSSGQSR